MAVSKRQIWEPWKGSDALPRWCTPSQARRLPTRLFILATLGAIGALGVVGCGKGNSRTGTGGTGAGGAGGAGGADGVGGTSGTGGTGGTGAGGTGTGGTVVDTTPLPGIRLMPNEEGFMKTGDNELGIQGAWYTFGCIGAVIEPAEGARFDNPGKMCFKGTAPMVTDQDGDGSLDYSTIWGAGMGFDLCAQSEEEAGDAGVSDDAGKIVSTKYFLSACPYNADLATKLIGVAVRFSGVVNAAELRIQFNEGDKVANSYYQVAPADVAAGTKLHVEFEDPLVKTHYNPKLKPGDTDANYILAIQFMVPTNSSAPVDWDFCVEDIAAITAP
jgi:hypothetical protein